MDSMRAFEEESDYGFSADDEVAIEAPPEIGVDERRMHVRAYNYWVSLLDGRAYPSIADLKPQNLTDFGPNSVILDFSEGSDDPKVSFLGGALRQECGLIGDVRRISDVPKRSLLSRLTDHYLQIIANRAPIGFEAEFVGQRGHNTMYRGILMPFSSGGDRIDFIYGVINWKEVADHATTSAIGREAERLLAAAAQAASPIWADGPNAEMADVDAEEAEAPELPLGDDPGLADRLCAARDSAEALKGADARSRAALYRALSHAYDFAVAAEADPADYAEMLEDAGVKPQKRAPMTAVAKLVFGADYDKARLTEFAAALSFARREDVAIGDFRGFIETFDGGLKAVVQAERRARRPEPRPDAGEKARETMRAAPAVGFVDFDTADEFVIILARREGPGRVALVAAIEDAALAERAVRKAAA